MQVFECEDNTLCVKVIENWLLHRLSGRPYDTAYRVKRMNAAIVQLFTAPQISFTIELAHFLNCTAFSLLTLKPRAIIIWNWKVDDKAITVIDTYHQTYRNFNDNGRLSQLCMSILRVLYRN